MECPVCKGDNPEGNLFCGKCGAAFGPALQSVNREVERILQERFKDRGLVEYEVSDNLIKRFEGIFKASAWVFGSALSVLAIALVVLGSLGFKTYSEATTTIRSAAAAAVTEVNGTAKNAVEGITNSSQQAERVIDSYAKSPGLKKTVEGVEEQAKLMNARVAAVQKSAEENEKKLAALDAVRRSSPETKIGDLSPSVFMPSSSSPFGTSALAMPSAIGRFYMLGSQGEEVKTIQTQLKKRNCYAGPIGGAFDKATEDGVIAYKKAKASLPTVLNPALYTTASGLGFSTNEGSVDNTLFTELDSPLVIARCPDR